MKQRILIVDDEPQMLAGMRDVLEHSGYGVETAASGIEAAGRLRETRVPFDLVVTDMKMPRFSGLDLIRQLRRDHPATDSVLITAYGTVESAVAAMKMGASDYLMKPFNAELLLDVVRRTLGQTGERRKGREIISANPIMHKLMKTAGQAARTDATILIEAESGTGKELLARFIHESSSRKSGPFVAVNCAALPDNLLESELMGHDKGAFTGADCEKPGKFELADGGAILLDEIGEMAPLLQAKILRVLQEKEVDRIGGTRPVPVNVRVIATTNRDLKAMVSEGKFRQDLYFRLNVIPLRVPPLRERKDDIALLVDHFMDKYAAEGLEGKPPRLRSGQLEQLKAYDWPGNVRELENAVHRAVVLSVDGELDFDDILPSPSGETTVKTLSADGVVSLRDMEHRLIRETLEMTGGNRLQAAKSLQISVRTLRNKLHEMEAATA